MVARQGDRRSRLDGPDNSICWPCLSFAAVLVEAFAQAAGALPAELALGELSVYAKTSAPTSLVAGAPSGGSPRGTGGPPPQSKEALSSPRVASWMQLLHPGVAFNNLAAWYS